MQVLDANAGLLSNFELLELLKENFTADQQRRRPRITPLIEAQVGGYLSSTACKDEKSEQVAECVRRLSPFHLTKAEMLQVLNLSPKSEVEVHLIVEDCVDRLTSEQVTELLDVVQSYLCAPTHEEEHEDKENEAESATAGETTQEEAAGYAEGEEEVWAEEEEEAAAEEQHMMLVEETQQGGGGEDEEDGLGDDVGDGD
ncbi:DNA-directed RNA polymerase III subunit RPC9 [Balamuthia mandrillaris]